MKFFIKNVYKDKEYYWNGFRWVRHPSDAVLFVAPIEESFLKELKKNWSGEITVIDENLRTILEDEKTTDVVSLAQKMCNLCVEQDKLRPIPVAPKISIREWIDLAQIALDNS